MTSTAISREKLFIRLMLGGDGVSHFQKQIRL
jgi:hypothetical protein